MGRKKLFLLVGIIAGAIILMTTLRRGPVAERARQKADEIRGPGEVTLVKRQTSLTGVSKSTDIDAETKVRATPRPRGDSNSSNTRTLTGRVTLFDGSPVAGATVSANRGSTATTDSDGRYEISNLSSTIWGVSASHEDCVTSYVRRLEPDQLVQDFLLRKKVPVVLAGKVIMHDTKQPLAEFTATGSGAIKVTKLPQPPGQFEISGIFSGDEFSFRIEAPGMATRSIREEIPDDASGTINREYEMGAGATLKGRIVRSDSHSPVSGAGVSAQSFGRRSGRDGGTSVTTGEDGKFVISQLNPGQIRLQVTPGAPLIEISRFIGELGHNETRDLGDVEVGEGGTILGKVIKVPGNQPVIGEAVQLSSRGGAWRGGRRGGDNEQAPPQVVTDANGNFKFTKVPPGWHNLRIENLSVRENVTIEADEEKKVTLRVGSGILRGLIVKDGQPVKADVNFMRTSLSMPTMRTESREDGSFEMSGLAPGVWRVNIDPDGGRSTEQEVDMPEQGVLEKTFVLPSGDIVGTVVDAAGSPVPDADISLLTAQESPLSQLTGGGFGGFGGGRGGRGGRGMRSGADGTFRITDRQPGPISLMARKEGVGASQTVDITVPESGDSQQVTLRLEPTGGKLMSTALHFDTGGPMRDAWLVINSPKGRINHNERRSDDGIIIVTDIPPGTYTTQVSAMGFTVSEQVVQIRNGEMAEITDVINPAGSLRMTLVDDNGAGVANVRCRLVPEDSNSVETPREGLSDATGLWLVRGLLPGAYTATFSRDGFQPVSIPVSIGVGQLTSESSVVR